MSSNQIRSYIADLEALRKKINKVAGPQLQSKKLREKIQGVVDQYFANVRPSFLPDDHENSRTQSIDPLMQELLVLSHRNSSISKYKTLIDDIKKFLILLDGQPRISTDKTATSLSDTDKLICQTLDKLLPSAAQSYKQALRDLATEDRLSWRGPATDLREALRETLDYLAPDDQVMAQSGFKLEKDTTGPTMKQKVRFILRNRGNNAGQSDPIEVATQTVEELLGKFVRSVYVRSNVSTHTQRDKKEVLRVCNLVRTAFCELLEV